MNQHADPTPLAWPPQGYPTTPTQFRPTLRDRTLHALRQHMDSSREPLKHIAEQSGVGFHWLKTFSLGTIPNPTVENIERLYFYLTKRVL